MQKSFVVKATLCIEECQFYLRAGDVLMYESTSHRLTVYRNNEIVKNLKQTPLGIGALVKTGILTEVVTPTAAPVVAVAPLVPSPAPTKSPVVKPKAEKTSFSAEEFTPEVKRAKAQAKLVVMPEILKQALAEAPVEEKTPEPIA